MARVFLHIGMTKTGSTSIQAAFHQARETLVGFGFDYLDMGQNHSRVTKVALRGSSKRLKGEVVKQLGIAKGVDDYEVGPVRRLLEEKLARPRAETVIISGEGFFNLSAEEVHAFRELLGRYFDEARVVVYVRDPVSWASSRAQENVKHGHTIAELADSATLDPADSPIIPHYRRQLEPYFEAFGRDHVDVRPFDRRRFVDGDLIADFCRAIGAGPEVVASLPRPWNNPRTSHEALLLIEQHYRILADRRAAAGSDGRKKAKKNKKAKTGKATGTEDGKAWKAARVQAESPYGPPADDPDTRALNYWFRTEARQIPGTPFALPLPVLETVWREAGPDVAWLRETTGDPTLFADAWPPATPPGPAWTAETVRAIAERLEDGMGRRRRSEALLWLRSGPQAKILMFGARLRRAVGL